MDRRKYIASISFLSTLTFSGCVGTDRSGDEDREESASTVTTTREHETVSHDIGEPFTVTDARTVRYRVLDATVQERVGGDDRGEEANELFLVVTLKITNVGNETFNITDRHLRIFNNRKREYEADFDASAFAGNDPRIDAEGIGSEKLESGQTVIRAVLFDITTGDGYALKIEHTGVFEDADEHWVYLGSVWSGSLSTPIDG
jgi:hypothetical protein